MPVVEGKRKKNHFFFLLCVVAACMEISNFVFYCNIVFIKFKRADAGNQQCVNIRTK